MVQTACSPLRHQEPVILYIIPRAAHVAADFPETTPSGEGGINKIKYLASRDSYPSAGPTRVPNSPSS